MRPASRVRDSSRSKLSCAPQRSPLSDPRASHGFWRLSVKSVKSVRRALTRGGALVLLLGLVAALAAVVGAGHASAHSASPSSSSPSLAIASGTHVDELTFDRAVDPASARFLEDGISTAEGDGATALIVILNTPGGDLESMQSMVEAELASSVPILVFVGPPGAFAASAGTFLALGAPVVAMAPDTTIGAASPVNFDGSDIGATEKVKVENTLLQIIDQEQHTYNRSTPDAEAAIIQAQAFPEAQAVSDDMVNLEADSVANLIAKEDGQQVTLATGTSETLRLTNLPIETLEPTFINQVETVLFDPNLDFILFIIAIICIYLEVSHPGAIVPGTIGILALILFLLGAQSLNPDWAGLALMLAGLALLAVDVRVPTHGVLTFGGLICLALGSFIFFDTGVTRSASGPTLSPALIVGLCVGVGAVALLVLRFAARARRGGIGSGAAGLVGQDAIVLTAMAPEGRVRVFGEDWLARLDPLSAGLNLRLEPGQTVRVLRVDGLVLVVEPVIPASALQKGALP